MESSNLNYESNHSEDEKRIHYLLFEYLNETTAEDCARNIKKLDCSTNEEFLIQSFIDFAKNGTYYDLDCASYVLSLLKDSGSFYAYNFPDLVSKIVK